MINKNELFGTKEIANQIKHYLLAQCSIVKGILSKDLDFKSNDIKIVLASSCNTATAIAKLSEEEDYFYAEVVMLARSFIEKIVNFCYLLICDKEEYDNFRKHTIQKAYRKLDRTISIGNEEIKIAYQGKDDYLSNQELRDAIGTFTSSKGKEITRWTKKSINDRIKILKEKSQINIGLFMLNTLSIYDNASESLHGTLYGCSYHTWAYDPSINHKDKEAIKINTFKNLTLLCWQLGEMLNETIVLLSKSSDLSEFVKASKNNSKNTLEIMKAIIN